MTKTHSALVGFVLAFAICSHLASAQYGPVFESAPEPIVDLIETKARPIEFSAGDTEKSKSETLDQVQSGSKPIGLPRSLQSTPFEPDKVTTPAMLGKEFVRTVAALGGVLLLIFALAHIYKRFARTRGGLSGQMGAGGRAPAGLVEVLGRYPISSGMTLVVLRFDRKILLLSHAGAKRGRRSSEIGSMQTLCEVGDLEDVASILKKARDQSGDSISASFEKTLHAAGNATDKEIAQAMYEPSPGVHVQRPRRIAPGFVSNDEGDRLELTSAHDSPAASQVLRRRLGAMRRGR